MHIIITGYYKKNNLGDDLFESIAKNIFLRKEFKNEINSYKTISIDDLTNIENMTNCDRVILFGGETLNDYFLDKLIELYKLKPTIKFNAIGVSCNQDYNSIINKISIFENIIFRNETDYNNLSKYITSTYSSDIVFLKNIYPIINFMKKKIIGFFLAQPAIYNLDQNNEHIYINFFVNLIKYWIKLDYKIYLFAMCTNNNSNAENDMILNQKILSNLSEHEKSYIKAYSNNNKVLTKISSIRFAICWRFHAHVLCMIYNIPFISLADTPKVKLLLNENNLNILHANINNYKDKLDYLINNENEIKRNLKKNYKINKKKSEIYLKKENYLFNKKENTFYIDKNTFELIYKKLKDYYNRYKTNDNYFNAQIVIFFLMRTLNSEYLYGLQEKIYKSIDKLQDDIFWLINDCIIKKNLLFYESVSELLNKTVNKNGYINIKYLDQNDYKDLHRSGWQYVVDNLEELHGTNGILCDLYLDRTFHWNYNEYAKLNIIPYKRNWIGFIHHTCNTSYSIYNTVNLFKKKLFIESLEYCSGLIVLSEYLKSQIEFILNDYKLNIKVFVLYHPTQFISNENMFTPKKFTLSIKKKIIQIGAWMRNIHAINKLDIDDNPLFLDKYVLIGKKMDNYYNNDDNDGNNSVFEDDESSIDNKSDDFHVDPEIIISRDHQIRKVKLKKNVNIIRYLENNNYDDLLSESLVFLNLIDASAVNTVIECIVRNTPLYVNKIPALEEILGNKYPLFYDNITDVPNMLTMEHIDKGYLYLKNLNKDKLKIEYFMEKFRDIVKSISQNNFISEV